MNKVILFSVLFVALVISAEAMPKEQIHVNVLDEEADNKVDIDEDIPYEFSDKPCNNPRGDC
uniref:SP13 phlebotomine family member n=1 Tax=Nyssomyia intermedia TaxID=182990 RepID=J7HBR6_9DIPT